MSEVKTDSVVNVSGDNDSGIDLSTNDVVAIKTADSEQVRVDADGHVGINNTTPGSYLEGELVVGNSTKDQYVNVVTGSGNAAGLCFQDQTGTSIVGGLRYTHSDNALQSWTNGSERMRILSNGAIAHGGTTQIENCFYNQHFAPATFAGIGIKPTTNSGYDAMRFNNNGGSRIGTIACTTTSTSYNTSSDHRLKENVADMTGAIDRVKTLAPKRFNFIADADTTVDGFLAHEAQTVVPEAVSGIHNEVDDDGNAVMQGIDQSKLVPLLTGALKEAIAKIEALEARVTALEDA